ncbi:MAG: FadR/GntR family transcriptional regulator [Propylenella sp.]
MSSSSSQPIARPATAYAPIRPRSLTHEVVERIRADIASGELAAGARLPTEQEMIAAFQVSRTVVREAVAALRAEGLVATRQGVGAFVVDDAEPRPFSLAPGGLGSIDEVLDLMELRTAVETEAAGLAAERATQRDIRALETALTTIDDALDRGELAIEQDFAFHRAIAKATGNAHFLRFLEFLGRYIIPRQSVRVAPPDSRSYLTTIQGEHRDIVAEIASHSVSGAQNAMRRHLTNSRRRYAKLAGKQRG